MFSWFSIRLIYFSVLFYFLERPRGQPNALRIAIGSGEWRRAQPAGAVRNAAALHPRTASFGSAGHHQFRRGVRIGFGRRRATDAWARDAARFSRGAPELHVGRAVLPTCARLPAPRAALRLRLRTRSQHLSHSQVRVCASILLLGMNLVKHSLASANTGIYIYSALW